VEGGRGLLTTAKKKEGEWGRGVGARFAKKIRGARHYAETAGKKDSRSDGNGAPTRARG